MKKHLPFFLVLSFILFNNHLPWAQATEKTSFSVMTYNMENLFDANHDEGRVDYEYLPLALKQGKYRAETEEFCKSNSNCLYKDWTPEVYQAKLQNMAKVISFYQNGQGPDVLVMEEVENIRTIQDLAKVLGPQYKYVRLIEDADQRGIDVGVISKIEITQTTQHNPPNSGLKRGIFEIDFKIKNQKFTVLGNHWPSQMNPVDMRLTASKIMEDVADSIKDADLVICVGDYNTPDRETPNAIHNLYDQFLDVKPYVNSIGMNTFPGTYYYKGNWETLDRFLLKKADLKFPKIVPLYNTFEVVTPDFAFEPSKNPNSFGNRNSNQNGPFQNSRMSPSNGGSRLNALKPLVDTGSQNASPLRFNWKTKVGYSDHLPVAMKFELR